MLGAWLRTFLYHCAVLTRANKIPSCAGWSPNVARGIASKSESPPK